MNEIQWFRATSRAFGVWMLLDMVSELRTLLIIQMNLFKPVSTPVGVYIVHAAIDAAVAAYLLWGANHLTIIVFGQEKRGFDVEVIADLEEKV